MSPRIGAICRATIGKEIEAGLKALPNAQTARQALLSDSDVRHVVDAAYGVDPDLGALVLTLASTGARFGQAAKITVADLQPEAGRVMVPGVGEGQGNEATALFSRACRSRCHRTAQAPDQSGAAGMNRSCMRWIMRQIGPATWEHVRRAAWRRRIARCRAAGARRWRRRACLRSSLMRLRHSSIVRGLRSGVPVRIVAALHDTSSSMIEKHYSAFILDAADELARRAVVPLVSPPVTPLSVVA